MAKNRTNKPLRRSFRVPIYHSRVRVIVADDIMAERKRLKKTFGFHEGLDVIGCCSYVGGEFALFLEAPTGLRRSVVAHEVFHLTYRMAQRHGLRLSDDTNEAYALLNEFLTQEVNKILDQL